MRLGYGQDIEKDADFTVNESANNVFVIQYMVFTSLKSYVIIMWVVKEEGDKCDLETVVSFAEVLAAY